MKICLQRNLFPPYLIDKTVKNVLNKQIKEGPKIDCRYFKLPYIGRYSDITQEKIKKLCFKYCNNMSIKVVFSSFKIKDLFSNKDPLPKQVKSNIVYKFQCANCNVSYIGETTRHFNTRINEHLKTDKHSHVYKHTHSDEKCFDSCNEKCFSILDTARTKYQLKIKEGLYIEWERPELNRQVFHYSISIN